MMSAEVVQQPRNRGALRVGSISTGAFANGRVVQVVIAGGKVVQATKLDIPRIAGATAPLSPLSPLTHSVTNRDTIRL